MGLRETFFNALGLETLEVQKTNNSLLKSSRDFLKYGSRDRLYPTWSDIKMPDQDMYRGYSYAVIQKRGNKVATLAKDNLKTTAKAEVVDEYQKHDETVIHPYLKLISDSTSFTEKQFWKNISIYLDLAGRYYLGVIRTQITPKNPNLKTIITDPTSFIMLNPYEIRRVINSDGVVAGYIERKKDGRYREWPLWQIIEMRELNPFDPENSQWAMTDAAKDAVFTMNQSSDYTRQSLNGNVEAPGIITTDVLLSDEDFANFRARVTQHTKGEPLFGNGVGAINWDSMQIDLDKAALMDINEINRTTLFAVSGTSKTSLGIEQSGTTRETARVQSEQFISDTAQPRLEDIVDFLNLDYKRHYNDEYKKTKYCIEVASAVGTDYATETQAVGMRQAQVDLAMNLMNSGYTMQSAYQFAEGEIDLADLELEKGIDKPQNPNQPQEPESPENPDQPTQPTPTNDNPETDNPKDLNGLTPHSDLVENGGKGSGNFGHSGRPGYVGGSGDGAGASMKEVDSAKLFVKKEKISELEALVDDWKKEIDKAKSEGKDGRVEYLSEYYKKYKKDLTQAKKELKSLSKELSEKYKNSEGENSHPLDKCTCGHDHKIETYINRVTPQEGKILNESYKEFLEEIRKVEKETVNAVITKLTINSFTKDDLLGKRKKTNLWKKLQNAIYKYWWAVVPMFANNSMDDRNKEFGKDITFTFTNDIESAIGKNADKVAESHLNTILDDILDASNQAYTEVQEQAAADLIVEAYEKAPGKFADYFNEPPTRVEALEAVQKTDILERNKKIYEQANKMAYEGYDRRTITKAIRAKYKDISEKRATTIARNETSRAFTQSQYQADKQFLNAVGKIQNAYKVWKSRRPESEKDKICPYCQKMIEMTNANPIPFEQPFLGYGESIEVLDNGKVRSFTANYESIQGGTLHVNCQCTYELVFKNEAGEFVKTLNQGEKDNDGTSSNLGDSGSDSGDSGASSDEQAKTLNGGKGSGNFGHKGRPGEVGGSGKGKISSMNYDELLKADGPGESQKVAGDLSKKAMESIREICSDTIDNQQLEQNLKILYEGYLRESKNPANGTDFDKDLDYEQYKQKVLSGDTTIFGIKVDGKYFPGNYDTIFSNGASSFINGLLNYASGANAYGELPSSRKTYDERHKISETIDNHKELWSNYDKPLYRGVSTSKEQLEGLLKKGAEINMNGVSSWSSEKDISKEFTRGGLIKTGDVPVVFIDKTPNRKKTMFYPFSSGDVSGNQYEFIQSGSLKYKVGDIHKQGDTYYVEVKSY